MSARRKLCLALLGVLVAVGRRCLRRLRGGRQGRLLDRRLALEPDGERGSGDDVLA